MKFALGLILAALTANGAFAQLSVLSKVNVTFSIPADALFPNGLVGGFTHTLEVPQTGTFATDVLTPDTFALSPSKWGATTFTRNDVGVNLSFVDGTFAGVFLGGLYETVNFVSFGSGGPVTPSDFYLALSGSAPQSGFFFYQFDGQQGGFAWDFSFSMTVSPAEIAAVPEPSSYGIGGAFIALAVLVRRRWGKASQEPSAFQTA